MLEAMQIISEGNSRTGVNRIAKPDAHPDRANPLLVDIWRIASSLTSFEGAHVYKDNNSIVD